MNFYIRPLASILDKYSPACVLLVSRREAVWYSVAMGEIKALDRIESDVPGRVREGGFEGTEAKRIERHVDAHLQDHYKKSAQKTFEISKKMPFDWLLIGCEDNHSGDFEAHLHSYLRDKVKARLHAHPTDPPAKVLQEVLEVESRLKKAEEEETVQKLVAELERGGLATSGLRDTIHRLNQFEVQTLVVTHNLSRPGGSARPTGSSTSTSSSARSTTRRPTSCRTSSTRPSRRSSSAAERSGGSSRPPSSTATAGSAPSQVQGIKKGRSPLGDSPLPIRSERPYPRRRLSSP